MTIFVVLNDYCCADECDQYTTVITAFADKDKAEAYVAACNVGRDLFSHYRCEAVEVQP